MTIVGRNPREWMITREAASWTTPTPVRSRARQGRSRLARHTLSVALAALLVLPAAAATQPAEAGKKFKTITQTFSSSAPISIEDQNSWGPADPYPAMIDVAGFKKLKKAKITDVNLTLRGLTHEQPKDIDLMLVHGDRRAVVMSDIGNAANISNTTISLDDEVAEYLPVGGPLQSGVYHPLNHVGGDQFSFPAPQPYGSNVLSEFDGLTPNGEWRLFIMDDTLGELGSLDGGWELEITAKGKAKKHKK